MPKRRTPEESKREAEAKAARALARAVRAMNRLMSACRKCGEPVGGAGNDSRARLTLSMQEYSEFLYTRLDGR